MGATVPTIDEMIAGADMQPATQEAADEMAQACACGGQTDEQTKQERQDTSITTVVKLGPIWLRQGIINLPILSKWPTVADLVDEYHGRPFVCVAPGPSLDANIEKIAALKGKAVICAYSRAVGALLRHGIEPDLSVVLDPLDLVYHFDGIPLGKVGAIVIGCTCSPRTVALPWQRMVSFSGNDLIETWLMSTLTDGRPGMLETNCSVATTTVSLGILLGCSPIIMVGQDLAFPDGRMYSSDTPDGAAMLNPNGQNKDGSWSVVGLSDQCVSLETRGQAMVTRLDSLHQLPAWDGNGMVQTSPNFRWVNEWMAGRANDHPGRFWNCTEGGSRIDGMEHILLDEAIERLDGLPECDIIQPVEAACRKVDVANRRTASLDLLLDIRRRTRAMETIMRSQRNLAAKLPKDGLPTKRWVRRWNGLSAWQGETMRGLEVMWTLVDQEHSRLIDDRARTVDSWPEVVAIALALNETIDRFIELTRRPLAQAIEDLDRAQLA